MPQQSMAGSQGRKIGLEGDRDDILVFSCQLEWHKPIAGVCDFMNVEEAI